MHLDVILTVTFHLTSEYLQIFKESCFAHIPSKFLKRASKLSSLSPFPDNPIHFFGDPPPLEPLFCMPPPPNPTSPLYPLKNERSLNMVLTYVHVA